MTTTFVHEDPLSGDLYIELPAELLKAANLSVGDNIEWIVNDDGSCSFSRVE
jgi:antitoxin component of MazEF toxin-antitoxin module|tara:strand:+ start:367 stop:522 length:156 start_codon:yes stop_codon:yes gene_type:complete